MRDAALAWAVAALILQLESDPTGILPVARTPEQPAGSTRKSR